MSCWQTDDRLWSRVSTQTVTWISTEPVRTRRAFRSEDRTTNSQLELSPPERRGAAGAFWRMMDSWVQVSPGESSWVQLSPGESRWVQLSPGESRWVKVRVPGSGPVVLNISQTLCHYCWTVENHWAREEEQLWHLTSSSSSLYSLRRRRRSDRSALLLEGGGGAYLSGQVMTHLSFIHVDSDWPHLLHLSAHLFSVSSRLMMSWNTLSEV